jgi:putative transposase
MSYHHLDDQGQSFDLIRNGFLLDEGLPFAGVVSEKQIRQAFVDHDALFGQEEDDVYTPELTLWAMLTQVMAAGAQRSCNAAVERLRSLCLALGLSAPSPDSGEYCRARRKIPNEVLRDLTYQVADGLEAEVPEEWLWKGRHVKIADGSTLMAPDTPDNQETWPQPASQKSGLGFPIMRICALFSLATAALCGLAEAPSQGKQTGEPALLRSLLALLNDEDILMGDACFCSYFMIALLLDQGRGLEMVVHQHQRRKMDFRKGKSLGRLDHVVQWRKPQRPAWMEQATYDRLPATLTVRELRVKVRTPGSRAKTVTVVTTLIDGELYTKEDIAELYRLRWQVECDLRSLKVTMHMEDLRAKTPEMVRTEIWAHCLAYNLIRRAMAAAAMQHERAPRSVSFAGGLQTISGVMSQASTAGPREFRCLVLQKLSSIASHRVGHRPGRVEPRAVKRRPRKQKLLTKSRAKARAELAGFHMTAS